MNKLQERQYELLVELDRICKKNKIEYFLDGGTLLGAVRHKGFIPWDDDLDVGMLRKDYEKFKKIITKDLDEKYFFQDMDNDKNYGFPFGKLRINNTKYTERIASKTKAKDGIYIDIFPFDYIDNDEAKSKKDFLKVVILRMLLLLKKNYIIDADTFKKKIEKVILKIMSAFVSSKYLIKKINKITNKFNNQETKYVANFASPYFNKNRFKIEWIKDKKELQFEKGKYMCLKNYDDYLTYVYNDYMTLPPVEKRRSHDIIDVEFEDGSTYKNN